MIDIVPNMVILLNVLDMFFAHLIVVVNYGMIETFTSQSSIELSQLLQDFLVSLLNTKHDIHT